MNPAGLTISPLGDTAILISFGNKIDETLNSKVLSIFFKIKGLALPGVKDLVPGYSTLAIFYDLLILENKKPVNKSCFENFTDQIQTLLAEDIKIYSLPSRKIKIPVCYVEQYALDLQDIANEKKMPVAEIIRRHTAKTYRVYMTGFLPGFPYMGEVDEAIAMPRKAQPRLLVEAGSVGIAGTQTGIYPLNSPGGWQIIGRTPLSIFNADRADPVALHPGDEVEFYSISEDEFTNY